MIQFYKVFSLVLRVFTKPVVNYTKQYHISRKRFSHTKIRKLFIYLGNKHLELETLIENYSANTANNINKKIINDDEKYNLFKLK